MRYLKNKAELEENGFSIIENIYSESEISQIITCIENNRSDKTSTSRTANLFAIRQLLNTNPELPVFLFTDKLNQLIEGLCDSELFLTKAIYFDKPKASNWFVSYHQDLSTSVDQKVDVEGYKNWTFKKGQYGVQPPLEILKDTITIRIHLDNTTSENGALKVVPKSHLNGVIRADSKDWNTENESVCEVQKGGALLMKPLTLHASNRTTNDKQRRVIHLEYNKHRLAEPLNWLEYWSNNQIVGNHK